MKEISLFVEELLSLEPCLQGEVCLAENLRISEFDTVWVMY